MPIVFKHPVLVLVLPGPPMNRHSWMKFRIDSQELGCDYSLPHLSLLVIDLLQISEDAWRCN